MSLNCNLDLMCGSSDGLGDFIFLLPFWGSNLNAYYKNYVPATATFKRASAATQVDDLGLTPVGIDVPKLNKGIILDGSATNKVTCAKSNPQDLTNIAKTGDAEAVLSVAYDAEALAAAGLSAFGPNVYKLDNSAGTSSAFIDIGGTTGNTNVHSLSVYIRGTGAATLRLTSDTASSQSIGSVYTRLKTTNVVPVDASRNAIMQIPAGSVGYITLPQLEEGPVCTSPISGGTGAITRASEGADTSGNGLSLALSQQMVDSLTGELLNGAAAWSHVSGTAPAYSGGNRILTYSGALTSSDYHALSATLIVGKQVEVRYTISGYAAGSIAFGFGSGAAGTSRSANGTYTETGTLTGNTNIYANATGFTGVLEILSVRRVLENGQVNPGAGTICQWVDLPWASSEVTSNTNINVISTTNTGNSNILLQRWNGYWQVQITDGLAYPAYRREMQIGRYCIISQWSAALGKMRVGLYDPATGALTLGNWATYRGFFTIYGTGDQQRLRYYYGGSQLPIHISSTAWYDRVLTDNEILRIIPALTK